jgi:molybdate transport system substrate-binding protein
MADPGTVPAGKYGKEALTRLGVWASVQDKVANAENVRTALALVARGEAPLGVVYTTDALADHGVRIVGTFPPAQPHADFLSGRRADSGEPSRH